MISPSILARIPVFRGLPDLTAGEILEVVRRAEVTRGTKIFVEGEAARSIYYLERGKVVVSIAGRPGAAGGPVHVVEPGECFGWSALVPPHEFTAAAQAREDSTVLVIDGTELKWRMRRHPELAWAVFENLAATIAERLAGARVRLLAAEMPAAAAPGRR
jgi:CRP-like cAMP-binding protein